MSNYRIPKYKSQQFSHFTTLNRVILSKYSILLNIINLAQIVLIGKMIPKQLFTTALESFFIL